MTKTQLKKATKIIYNFEADSKILKQIARWIPRRNTLSNANTKRDPAMAEDVFWGLFRHLSAIEPDFDQHQLIGFLAPRLAYVSAATMRSPPQMA
jgi:hypothetical protein